MHESTQTRRSSLARLAFQLIGLWQQGTRPDLKSFLDRAGPLSPDELLELVEEDQRESWQHGERRPFETYLAMFPPLAENQEFALILLYREVLLREELGESPQVDEYIQRFPDHADKVRDQFDLHRALEIEDFSDPDDQPATQPHQPPDYLPPPDIPGYELLGVLGKGGMGVVYWVLQHGLRRTAALKMMHRGEDVTEQDLTRFRNEARAIARLQHPNIVGVYDVGDHHGDPFITLEYVNGGNLTAHLAANTLTDDEAAKLIETLARATHHAHDRGIIHRDLKPGNVLRTTEGEPKITDFGLAKVLFGAESARTNPGAILGTPSYMAPEQARGHNEDVGAAADTYALGAILYEVLTGRPPFRGASPLETLDQVCNRDPVPPRSLQPRCPPDLETICLKCLQKEPQRRYSSAEALADDLRRFLERRPIAARPASALERAVKLVRRRPAASALVAVVLLAALGITGLLVWHHATLVVEVARAQARASLFERKNQYAEMLRQGQELLNQEDRLDDAHALAARVIEKVGDDAALAEQREAATRLQNEVERRRDDRKEREAAASRYRTLFRQVLHHAMLFTGSDPAEEMRQTQDAARKALAIQGVTLDADAEPFADQRGLTPQEKQELRAGCYELLLVLAETVAYQLPGQTPEERKKNAREATEIIDRAARLKISTKAYHLRRARYLFQSGDLVSARLEVDEARKMEPESALDCYLVGEDYFRQRRPDLARPYFEHALRLRPDHFLAQYVLALCHLRLKQWQAGKVGLSACLAHPQAESFVWLYLLRAFAHGELKEFAAADLDFEQAEKLKPEGSALYGLYVNRGVVRVRQERFKEAKEDLEAAITMRPRQYPAYVNLAQLCEQQKDLAGAVKYLTQAIEREPSLAPLYSARGRLHRDLKDRQHALEDLELAVAPERVGSTPAERAEDFVERGLLLQAEGRPRDALDAFDEAVKLFREHPTVHYHRAGALLKLRDDRGALAALDSFLDQDPQRMKKDAQHLGALRARGHLRMRQQDVAGALADYNLALLFEPEDGPTLALRGWAYLAEDAGRLALGDFTKVLEADANNADAHAGLALARLQTGKYREALDDADKAWELGRKQKAALVLYHTARVFARAPRQIEADRKLTPREVQELSVSCDRKALEALRDALKAMPMEKRVPFWRDDVKNVNDFARLGDSRRFHDLEKEFIPSP